MFDRSVVLKNPRRNFPATFFQPKREILGKRLFGRKEPLDRRARIVGKILANLREICRKRQRKFIKLPFTKKESHAIIIDSMPLARIWG